MTHVSEAMDLVSNDEFDLLLNDVLRSVSNPELPERVLVETRARVHEITRKERTTLRPPAAVFAPDVFLAKMHAQGEARSPGYAMLAHAAAILLLCWAVSAHVRFAPLARPEAVNVLTAPPPVAPMHRADGGGGGSNNHAPVAKGQLPKFAPVQITPPKTPVETRIKAPDPAIEVVTNLQMANPNMPNFGMPNSSVLGDSLGEGHGSGIGSGNGPGLGAGTGGNWGGGLRKVGGRVSEPVVRTMVQPEFSEEARHTRHQGSVTVDIIVDPKGIPENVHVVRGIGMGLDEKAVEAVKQYRFWPALEDGKPVAVQMNVVVIFTIE